MCERLPFFCASSTVVRIIGVSMPGRVLYSNILVSAVKQLSSSLFVFPLNVDETIS